MYLMIILYPFSGFKENVVGETKTCILFFLAMLWVIIIMLHSVRVIPFQLEYLSKMQY